MGLTAAEDPTGAPSACSAGLPCVTAARAAATALAAASTAFAFDAPAAVTDAAAAGDTTGILFGRLAGSGMGAEPTGFGAAGTEMVTGAPAGGLRDAGADAGMAAGGGALGPPV